MKYVILIKNRKKKKDLANWSIQWRRGGCSLQLLCDGTEAGNWKPKPTFGICTWASSRRLNKINQNKAILQMLNFWSRYEWHLWMFWYLLLAQNRLFEKFLFFSFGRESSIILILLHRRVSLPSSCRSSYRSSRWLASQMTISFVLICVLFSLDVGELPKILFWIEKEGWIGCITYH